MDMRILNPACAEGGARAGVGPEGGVGLAVVLEPLAGGEAAVARHAAQVVRAADEDVAGGAALGPEGGRQRILNQNFEVRNCVADHKLFVADPAQTCQSIGNPTFQAASGSGSFLYPAMSFDTFPKKL